METRIKRQRQPTAQKSGEKEQRAQHREDDRKKQRSRRKKGLIIAILAVAIIMLILLFVKGCSAGNLPLSPPDYEEDASGLGDDGSIDDTHGDDTRINLAVMDDCTVNKDFPDFTVAYPSQNHYDIEISFREPKSGKEVYRTKRIRRGTVVAIPGYTFLKSGKNKLDAVIGVYDPDTWEMENEATTMKIAVTKE